MKTLAATRVQYNSLSQTFELYQPDAYGAPTDQILQVPVELVKEMLWKMSPEQRDELLSVFGTNTSGR